MYVCYVMCEYYLRGDIVVFIIIWEFTRRGAKLDPARGLCEGAMRCIYQPCLPIAQRPLTTMKIFIIYLCFDDLPYSILKMKIEWNISLRVSETSVEPTMDFGGIQRRYVYFRVKFLPKNLRGKVPKIPPEWCISEVNIVCFLFAHRPSGMWSVRGRTSWRRGRCPWRWPRSARRAGNRSSSRTCGVRQSQRGHSNAPQPKGPHPRGGDRIQTLIWSGSGLHGQLNLHVLISVHLWGGHL